MKWICKHNILKVSAQNFWKPTKTFGKLFMASNPSWTRLISRSTRWRAELRIMRYSSSIQHVGYMISCVQSFIPLLQKRPWRCHWVRDKICVICILTVLPITHSYFDFASATFGSSLIITKSPHHLTQSWLGVTLHSETMVYISWSFSHRWWFIITSVDDFFTSVLKHSHWGLFLAITNVISHPRSLSSIQYGECSLIQ